VMNSAETLLSLLNDILDLSKIEAGRMELDPVPISLVELLREATHFLRTAARQKRLELTDEAAPNIPDQLLGDPLRLRQVLVNLIGNAIKFTETGGILGKAAVEEEDTKRVTIRFSVCDTGPGIPEHKQRLIFESFCQADGSISRKHGGTGLGLTISARLVDMMGGRIWVQSKLGEGSEFHFTAQFGRVRDGQPSAPAKRDEFIHEPGVETEAKTQLGGLSFLVAEDNFSNLKLVTRMLESWGQRVTIAVDGREALRLFDHQSFDVILLDLQMPEMDGLETAAAIRQREAKSGKHTPIIALTAHAGPNFRDECMAAGMDEFLTKPLHPRKLLNALIAATISQEKQG
jgi:CheY-like chemotaxis protein